MSQEEDAASAIYRPEPTRGAVWRWRNNPEAKPVSPMGRQVTIHVPPDTDIWRPSRDKHTFTAPFLYTTFPACEFLSVQVTVSAHWKTLFDQGGLVVCFPPPAGEADNMTRFVKTGIEFFGGEPQLGVVGTDVSSDWSLSPLLQDQDKKHEEGIVQATILIERNEEDLWVYVLEGKFPNRRRRPLRQITWAFGPDQAPVASDIEVGVYGAKPTRESGEGHEEDGIAVTLSDFKLHTA